MGLATHALALALGYALGNPEGRAKLVALRGRAGEAAKQASARPEVKQAREKAWDLAGEAGAKAKNRLTSGSRQKAAESAQPSRVDTSASDSPEYGTPSTTAPAYGVPASGPGSNSPSGTGTSGTGTSGTTATKSGAASSDQASKPASAKPASAKSASGAASSGAASATNGTTDTDRLAGTTVAEDSRAAVLGLPTPDADRPDPTTKR